MHPSLPPFTRSRSSISNARLFSGLKRTLYLQKRISRFKASFGCLPHGRLPSLYRAWTSLGGIRNTMSLSGASESVKNLEACTVLPSSTSKSYPLADDWIALKGSIWGQTMLLGWRGRMYRLIMRYRDWSDLLLTQGCFIDVSHII